MWEIITIKGLVMLAINGPFAVWMVWWAHKVVEDPNYEKRMFKKWEERKKLSKRD